MQDWPALFLINLIVINAALVPILVGLTCIRRLFRSRGFNRLIYGYTATFSWCMAYLVIEMPPDSGILGAVILAGAWLTLPLWLCIRDLTRATPTRWRKYLSKPQW